MFKSQGVWVFKGQGVQGLRGFRIRVSMGEGVYGLRTLAVRVAIG